jgi:LysR family hydrogen peroxide-inducible transcriptional activator
VGTLDAVLLALPIGKEGLEVVELFYEPFVLALPPQHPLTRQPAVCEADLVGEHVLLLEDGHCLRNQALAVCGFPPPAGADDFRASSLETLRQMVATGVGCTLLPVLATTQTAFSEDLVALRAFVAPPPGRTIGLVWRPSFPRASTVRAVEELIRRHLPPGVTAEATA